MLGVVVDDGRLLGGGGGRWRRLRRELLSCSQSQELSQLAGLASDWMIKSERPIRSRLHAH